MESLQKVEHWPILILEQLRRDSDFIVWLDGDEVLVVRAVVDRAKT